MCVYVWVRVCVGRRGAALLRPEWVVDGYSSLGLSGDEGGEEEEEGMGKLIIAGELGLSLSMCSLPILPAQTHTLTHTHTHQLSLWRGGPLIRPLKHSVPLPPPLSVWLSVRLSPTTLSLSPRPVSDLLSTYFHFFLLLLFASSSFPPISSNSCISLLLCLCTMCVCLCVLGLGGGAGLLSGLSCRCVWGWITRCSTVLTGAAGHQWAIVHRVARVCVCVSACVCV